MTRFFHAVLALAALTFAVAPPAVAETPDPVADATAFRKYFTEKFPQVKLEDFVNGAYAIDEAMRRQWQAIEQFPPYEFSLETGKEMFAQPFRNGKHYADCFPNGGVGIRQDFPYFDETEGKVVTLELALNKCREANGEPPLAYDKEEMAALTAYMAFTSRGKRSPPAANRSTSKFPTIRARVKLTRTASDISTRGVDNSISPARAATCKSPASGFAPRCSPPRSGF